MNDVTLDVDTVVVLAEPVDQPTNEYVYPPVVTFEGDDGTFAVTDEMLELYAHVLVAVAPFVVVLL